MTQHALAVSFDFGQTLADLDTAMLSRRLAERGIDAAAERLEAAVPAAWQAYNDAVHGGLGGHPWKILMGRLLSGAGVAPEAAQGAVDWLWTEQPRRNLWRRPIPGMIELVTDLGRAGVPVAVLSNSEGRLAELTEELGWRSLFAAIADSGKLGVEKPARAIFAWTAAALGVPPERVVHVGDSLAADVEGALAAGMLAVWFRGDAARAASLGERAAAAADAAEVRAALRRFGIRPG
jgi:putative hydrolase of the HAD superfamily